MHACKACLHGTGLWQHHSSAHLIQMRCWLISRLHCSPSVHLLPPIIGHGTTGQLCARHVLRPGGEPLCSTVLQCTTKLVAARCLLHGSPARPWQAAASKALLWLQALHFKALLSCGHASPSSFLLHRRTCGAPILTLCQRFSHPPMPQSTYAFLSPDMWRPHPLPNSPLQARLWGVKCAVALHLPVPGRPQPALRPSDALGLTRITCCSACTMCVLHSFGI